MSDNWVRVAEYTHAMLVPGGMLVRHQGWHSNPTMVFVAGAERKALERWIGDQAHTLKWGDAK